jgi:mercuric ion transport protein
MKIPGLFEKVGSLGTIVSAMGCPMCFPFLASLGASLGLGIFSAFEGLFINKLIPLFAIIVLISNLFAWISHRQFLRLLWGVLGPLMVLATLYLFWTDYWSTYMFYAGLMLMLIVSIWNMVSPPQSCTSVSNKVIINKSLMTCPYCRHQKTEDMPTDACLWFYECENCKTLLIPKKGDCCVFCSYGDIKCPPMQRPESCCEIKRVGVT